MEKRGDLTENSRSDFDPSDKVKYADDSSPYVAGEKTKHRLVKPVPLDFGEETPWNGELIRIRGEGHP